MTSDAYRRSGKWAWMKFSWGKKQKFITVVNNLETGDPLCLGRIERRSFFVDR